MMNQSYYYRAVDQKYFVHVLNLEVLTKIHLKTPALQNQKPQETA